MSRKIYVLLAGLGVIAAILAFEFAAARRTAHLAAYGPALEQLADEIIDLTGPLAADFARGVNPSAAEILIIRQGFDTIKAEFEALGPPPPELSQAHASMVEAIHSYQQAFGHLSKNTDEGAANPYDQEFLSRAMHGGENVHLASRALDASRGNNHCVGLHKLRPSCWLWSG